MTVSRRGFLGVLAVLPAAPAIVLRRSWAPDLVIRNGTVYDGLGGAGRVVDVVITGDRIVKVEPRTPERGGVEIDARGLAVAPGFIDIHSHGDSSLSDDPRAESLVRQGITTIVAGQDGSSRGVRGDDPNAFATAMRAIAEVKPSVNVASMVGLGTVRGAIVGADDRPATPDELRRMRAVVENAIAAGACGASSGLEYTPGAFASTAELIALCEPLAARRLPYATHMRNEDDRLLDSIEESIAVATGAKCPLQISHLKTQGARNWSRLDTVFKRIDDARRGGLDVAFDRYPYTAYSTGLTNLFPVWSRDGGTDGFFRRLDDTTTAARIRQETLAKVDLIGGWDNVMITSTSVQQHKAVEGARLGTYAKQQGVDPYEMALTLLRLGRGSAGMVGFAMSEENLDRILAHPLGMVCSDGGSFATEGPARRGSPHPRGLGSFPRVLGRYVRERKALTLQAAIHKMTAFPASRVKLPDRGRIAPNMFADVVVFDPRTVADTATYGEPFQYPVGIKAVVVNGTLALLDGARRDSVGVGRFLRP